MLKLDLTLPEINVILSSLSKMPYEAVMDLVPKIQKQAQAQIQGEGQPVIEQEVAE